MRYPKPLIRATLLRRYKRFLADVALPNGEVATVHCANTGKMTGCATPGDTVWLLHHDNPKRKYPLSWELTQTAADDWICVNTVRANHIAVEAIKEGKLAELQGYSALQTEVRYGKEQSRIDIFLSALNQPDCYIEVKSCTLLQEGQGLFPDTVTTRGQKHLRELMAIKQQGARAVLLFVVMHTGIHSVQPARVIDPQYATLFDTALKAGVECITCYCSICEHEIEPLAQPVTAR